MFLPSALRCGIWADNPRGLMVCQSSNYALRSNSERSRGKLIFVPNLTLRDLSSVGSSVH